MISRREFVKGGAVLGAATLVGGGGAIGVWDRVTRPESPGEEYDSASGVERIILSATLAGSSHNTQPWKFRVSPEAIEIMGDSGRLMGKADPRLRELHMSLGCALENATIAAADVGMPVEVEAVRDPGVDHCVRLRFFRGESAPDVYPELAEAIPARRTNRGAFDLERPIAPGVLAELGALAEDDVEAVWFSADGHRAGITELVCDATVAHVADDAIQRDSHRWYRMSRSEADEFRDGITVSGANLPAIANLFMGLFPPTPESFDSGWEKASRETHCGTAPAFGMLVIREAGDPGGWVAAGRTYQRMQLAARLAGISLHPLSQPLVIRDTELAADSPGAFAQRLSEFHDEGEIVLLFRAGYPLREQEPSLRRTPVIEGA